MNREEEKSIFSMDRRMTRRDFLKRSATTSIGIGLGLTAAGTILIGGKGSGGKKEDLVEMTWITPRGTLDVPDDYCLWVARDMGYFEELGLDVTLEPGPQDAFACTKFVDQNQADLGYPSPGVLTASIDQGMDVIMMFEMMIGQVFDFAVRPDSPIRDVRDIEGKTMSLGFAGWEVIVEPIFLELGIDPKSVNYIYSGMQMGQAVATGNADVALCWEGLRAQWEAQGLDLRYFIGQEFSIMPANGYAGRKSDLADPAKRELVVNFLKGTAMGIHFYTENSRAACQIMYGNLPAVREQMTPELAYESMNQLAYPNSEGERRGRGYGWHDADGWNAYLDIIAQLGQTSRRLPIGEVVTNELIDEANDFDRGRVTKDAKSFKLNDTWAAVEETSGPYY
jgi:NitT/TauT family transport system substrate-binding protein